MSSTARVAESLACAIQHHQAGRCNAAEAAYRQILEIEPLHAEAWHLLGMLCTKTGRHDQAVECISHTLSARPDWAEARLNLGIAWSIRDRSAATVGRDLPCVGGVWVF